MVAAQPLRAADERPRRLTPSRRHRFRARPWSFGVPVAARMSDGFIMTIFRGCRGGRSRRRARRTVRAMPPSASARPKRSPMFSQRRRETAWPAPPPPCPCLPGLVPAHRRPDPRIGGLLPRRSGEASRPMRSACLKPGRQGRPGWSPRWRECLPSRRRKRRGSRRRPPRQGPSTPPAHAAVMGSRRTSPAVRPRRLRSNPHPSATARPTAPPDAPARGAGGADGRAGP